MCTGVWLAYRATAVDGENVIEMVTDLYTIGRFEMSACTWKIRGVSRKFGEWYQKTNKTEDTNKLTLLAFKIIAILHNTLLATSIKLLETVRKGLFRHRSQNRCHIFGLPPHGGNPRTCDRFLKRPLLTVSRSFMNVANSVL
jgi:hypothetical protein